MAPRANWKGFLRLSLVTCPVALYPATSESEKVSFNQLNKQTGHRIKYVKVDADTGEEVPNEDIVKAYAIDKETFIEVSKEELDELALAAWLFGAVGVGVKCPSSMENQFNAGTPWSSCCRKLRWYDVARTGGCITRTMWPSWPRGSRFPWCIPRG